VIARASTDGPVAHTITRRGTPPGPGLSATHETWAVSAPTLWLSGGRPAHLEAVPHHRSCTKRVAVAVDECSPALAPRPWIVRKRFSRALYLVRRALGSAPEASAKHATRARRNRGSHTQRRTRGVTGLLRLLDPGSAGTQATPAVLGSLPKEPHSRWTRRKFRTGVQKHSASPCRTRPSTTEVHGIPPLPSLPLLFLSPPPPLRSRFDWLRGGSFAVQNRFLRYVKNSSGSS